MSIPTMPKLTASLISDIKSMLEMPPAEGTETPGAYAGSKQSKSIEMYLLPLLHLDFILSNMLEIPFSLISKGVTISIPDFCAFSSSSVSADLVPINKLSLKSIHLDESLITEP